MSIILEQLSKRYDDHPVVNNLSLEIADGEFFVLLGSSGSGKTTVLSMIAGLTGTDHGRVLLNGRDVTYLPTQARRVGFVFQQYALFQHMTVADNIEFGLRVRKVATPERRRRRDELLELVGLTGLGTRMPRQLSGGQQQRVALARALAHRPEVLLLDEPLGALDAKIRIELRRSLRNVQRELGIATILVTHDQEEAFELADRLGVMSFGRLLEVGPPDELYRRPQTEFVATFLGTANLMVGQAAYGGVQVGAHHFPLNHTHGEVSPQREGQRVQVLFRPEDVALAATPDALGCPHLGQGEVEQTVFSGSFERLRLRLPPLPGVRSIAPPIAFGDGAIVVEATRSQVQASELPLQPGQKVYVGVRQIHALAHPGLSFLIVSDGSPAAQAALAVAGQIARLAHARVTILVHGLSGEPLQRHLQEVKEQLGSGLAALEVQTTTKQPTEAIPQEVERQSYDLVVMGAAPLDRIIPTAEVVLQSGEHHLLLVPQDQPVPTRVLICVASGEPGKEDVFFAGRLVRHLGAEAALLTILPEARPDSIEQKRTERFLAAGARTLELMGVPTQTAVRYGSIPRAIVQTMYDENYDLVVMGAPLPDSDGQVSLNKVIGQVLRSVTNHPTLIVRSSARTRSFPLQALMSEYPNSTILQETI